MIVDCSSLLPKTIAGEGQEEVKEWVMKEMGLSELEKPAKREEGEKGLVEELGLYRLWVTRVSTPGMFSHSYIESPRTHILHIRLLQRKIPNAYEISKYTSTISITLLDHAHATSVR
jgi:hypothetical protein